MTDTGDETTGEDTHVGGDIGRQLRPIHDHILKPTKYPAANTRTPRPATMASETDESITADDPFDVAGADKRRMRVNEARKGRAELFRQKPVENAGTIGNRRGDWRGLVVRGHLRGLINRHPRRAINEPHEDAAVRETRGRWAIRQRIGIGRREIAEEESEDAKQFTHGSRPTKKTARPPIVEEAEQRGTRTFGLDGTPVATGTRVLRLFRAPHDGRTG